MSDTLLLACTAQDCSQEDPGLSGSCGHSTLGLLVSGQSGGSHNVGIIWIFYFMGAVGNIQDYQDPPDSQNPPDTLLLG